MQPGSLQCLCAAGSCRLPASSAYLGVLVHRMSSHLGGQAALICKVGSRSIFGHAQGSTARGQGLGLRTILQLLGCQLIQLHKQE